MKYIRYKKIHDWYQLVETAEHHTGIRPLTPGGNDFVRMDEYGLLTIYKGYAWNGASGPAPDTKSIMRGSCGHDALYQLITLGVVSSGDRVLADWLLFDMLREDGLKLAEELPWVLRGPARAWARAYPHVVYAAVRTFGDEHARWDPRSDEILTAP